MSERLTLFVSDVAIDVDGLPSEGLVAMRAVWGACAEPVLPPRRRVRFSIEERADGFWIMRDGEHVGGSGMRGAVHAALEQALYGSFTDWHPPPRAILHTAGLEIGGRVLLLTGHSGAGKSSLARALVREGAHYLSDELVICDGARLWGVPRTLQFEPVFLDAPLPSWLGEVDLERYRIPQGGGRWSAQPLWPVPPEAVRPGPYAAEGARVVVIARGEADAIEPLAPVQALAALHGGGSFGVVATDLGSLVGARAPRRLTWRTPEAAAVRLLELATEA